MSKIWDRFLVRVEAKKYKTRTEFYKSNSGAYDYARRHKLLDEVCQHMKRKQWNKERAELVAKKYECRSDFHKNSTAAYEYARKNKLLDEVCAHILDF